MNKPRENPDFVPDRRKILKGAFGVATAYLGASALGTLSGCSESSGGPQPLTVDLAQLTTGRRRVFIHGEDPIELLRSEEGVSAKSLLCSHQGCMVIWSETRQVYQCPCHDGQYDASGQVMFGPPTAPLTELPVTIDDNRVIVGG